MNRSISILMCSLVPVLVLSAPAVSARVVYVDDDAIGMNDGSSWTDAFTCLQDALAVALEGDEIRVAQGTYRPDLGAGIDPASREATFNLVSGIVLRAGYAGIVTADPDARNVELHPTILSGDCMGDDPDVQDAGALMDLESRIDNSLHVVTADQVECCVLDGFIIRGGHALDGGGGLYLRDSSLTVWNCTFTQNAGPRGGAVFVPRGSREIASAVKIHNCKFVVNSAMEYGGGLCAEEGSLLLTNCEFAANMSSKGGGLSSGLTDVTLFGCTFHANRAVHGGGLHHVNGNLYLIDCTFADNAALRVERVPYLASRTTGGAILVSNGATVEAVATDCLFRNNRAQSGGAIQGDVTALRGCRFTGNVAYERAGAIDGRGRLACEKCLFDGNQAMDNTAVVRCYGRLSLNNCTVVDNRSPDGSAFRAYGGHGARVDNVFTHCIVWGAPHGLDPTRGWLGKTTVTYCNVQGGYPGTGNLDADPCFAAPGHWDPNATMDDPTDDFWVEGDYHLKSRAGRWELGVQKWVQDEVTSPCIDAGDPAVPVGDEPEPNGGRINMGAYGATAQASKSYIGQP